MCPAFNISVPEDLHKEVNKYKQLIQISAVCQKALSEAVKEERAKQTGEGLVEIGARRLMKELKTPPSQDPIDYEDECYREGQEWAGSEASLEELKIIFENSRTDADGKTVIGNHWVLMDPFMNQCCVPIEVLKSSMSGDNGLFFSFQDGARNMWIEMKDILEEQGYDIDEIKKPENK